MSLKHILLGLIEEPQSGYDIKQAFNQVFRHFWSAELAQIYPTLARLEKDGLATSARVASSKGPAKKLFTRTKLGTHEHKQWLKDGPTVGKDKLAYLTQVFFLGDLTTKQRIRYFQKLRAHFVAELEELRGVDQFWSNEDPGYPDRLESSEQAKQFTLRLGLKKIASTVEWCDECIAVLEAEDKRKGKK